MVLLYDKDLLQNKFKLLMFSTFILFFNTAFSQDLQEFRYTINDSLKGIIKAEIEINNDSIFNGDFNFSTTYKDPNPFTPKTSFTYLGQYNKNIKSGIWTLSHKSFKALDNYTENEYQLGFNTTGKEIFVTANFEEGLATNKWFAVERTFENSKLKDTIYAVDATFKASKMIESLNANFPNLKVKLNFNDKGLADGEWIFGHNIEEQYIEDIISFKDGVYKNRKLIIDDRRIEVEQLGLDKDMEKPITISYDKGMSIVLDLVNFKPISRSFSASLFQKINQQSLSALDLVMRIFKTHDGIDIWQNFKGSEELQIGLFRIKKHPLSTLEKTQIAEIKQKIQQILQQIELTLNNSFLEIGKLNYEELNIQESVLNIYKNYVLNLKPLESKLNAKELEYINYNKLLKEWLPQQSFPTQVSYSFQGKEITTAHDFPKTIQEPNTDINSILNLVNKIYENVLTSNKKTDLIFNKMTKKEALSDREQEFINFKKKLIALYTNAENKSTYNAYHEAVSTNFIRLINDQFTLFSNLNIDQKEKQIDDYLDCYKNLEFAYKNIENFPLRLNRIDELYSLTTFNPYIMADMTERLKSRIYNAFEDYLKPYIINKLTTAQTCDDVNNTLQLFDNTYKRMVELIDEDTKDTEKQLKREKNPETIMEILDINPSIK
jgi:hypothetical protein